jgi:hypothetical protein
VDAHFSAAKSPTTCWVFFRLNAKENREKMGTFETFNALFRLLGSLLKNQARQ